MVSPKSPDSVTERQKGRETGGASDAAAAVCVASAQLKAAACLVRSDRRRKRIPLFGAERFGKSQMPNPQRVPNQKAKAM